MKEALRQDVTAATAKAKPPSAGTAALLCSRDPLPLKKNHQLLPPFHSHRRIHGARQAPYPALAQTKHLGDFGETVSRVCQHSGYPRLSWRHRQFIDRIASHHQFILVRRQIAVERAHHSQCALAHETAAQAHRRQVRMVHRQDLPYMHIPVSHHPLQDQVHRQQVAAVMLPRRPQVFPCKSIPCHPVRAEQHHFPTADNQHRPVFSQRNLQFFFHNLLCFVNASQYKCFVLYTKTDKRFPVSQSLVFFASKKSGNAL